MDLSEVKTRLGLNADATDEQVAQSLDAAQAILQAATTASTKLGLHAAATPAEIVAMLENGESARVTTLRGKLETMGQEMQELRETVSREKAESWVKELGARKVVNSQVQEVLLSLHMQNPEQAEIMATSLENVPSGLLASFDPAQRKTTAPVATGLAAEIERNMV
ncbi:hypothetical protein DmAi_22100 [Acetobacter persici]|uniref:Uncharacterized protein n=2 Tax=Acetobacter persici TaxID=1076596 RepID=A0A6V8I9C3_9PROT|nr:hypothetical protein HK19_13545 [Acetobacter persici]GFE94151.1 hypothetical protein DmAi_22100 [Acetobacter persici]